MNHFVGWGFFSSGWIEQSRSTRLGSKGQFSGPGKRDLSRDFFAGFSKVAGVLGAFCSGPFESPPESSAAMKLLRIPGTFKDPANSSISL
jgi:hypothetical protein